MKLDLNLHRAAIAGLGSAMPEKILTNADFEKFLDTTDEWITRRTGVKERRVVSDGQSTASLGTEAARAALADAGIAATDLDLILCATISPDMVFPATACFIQEAIGAKDVPAFDISAACSGFVYALAVANGFIASGAYRKILIIGAESLTRFADYTDRGSCILFGDGAGAAVLTATTDPNKGLQYFRMGADGAGWDYIHVPAGGSRTPASHKTVDDRKHFIRLRGHDVYKFAVQKMSYLIDDAMATCGLSADQIDLLVPHQVNIRIIESAAQRAGFPMDRIVINIDRFGNTSAASIPIALVEAKRDGRLHAGTTVLMVSFGGGLTWAGALIKL